MVLALVIIDSAASMAFCCRGGWGKGGISNGRRSKDGPCTRANGGRAARVKEKMVEEAPKLRGACAGDTDGPYTRVNGGRAVRIKDKMVEEASSKSCLL